MKLADFGLSKVVTVGNGNSIVTNTSNCGTFDYMAPEVVGNEARYGRRVDIW